MAMDMNKGSNKTELDKLGDKFKNKYIGVEPMLLIGVIAVIIIYYYIFSSLGNNEDGSSSSVKVFFETILWFLFIILILLNGITYIFGIDLIKTIKNLFGYNTNNNALSDDISEDDKTGIKIMLKEQVFHVPENKYNYEDATAICKAYGSRLATYDEVDQAFNKGADWCSYGWSDGQMALYPTQKEKWEKLQKMKGHEKDCGRTGINGGYMDDATLKFGVNCYGAKPGITPQDAQKMRETPIFQKNKKEVAFDNKVNLWRNKLSQIELAPFNHNNWSML
jgi:hypothetical protein